MAGISVCPDRQLLQQLALGQLLPKEVEELARHCETCAQCIETLHSLKAEDSLVQSMASLTSSGGLPAAPSPELTRLMEKLQSMVPETRHTVVDIPLPGSGAEAPVPNDTLSGLAPPEGPGELGRLGGYRVLKVLGSGGMGLVYLGEDVSLQRPVALKVMKAHLAGDKVARERFLHEARAAARLKSEHIVTIYQVGTDHETVFLAMEYLEGQSLEDWLKQGNRPTAAQAAHIGRHIALGLADTHEHGLVHRDIKPANIWLESREEGGGRSPEKSLLHPFPG